MVPASRPSQWQEHTPPSHRKPLGDVKKQHRKLG